MRSAPLQGWMPTQPFPPPWALPRAVIDRPFGVARLGSFQSLCVSGLRPQERLPSPHEWPGHLGHDSSTGGTPVPPPRGNFLLGSPRFPPQGHVAPLHAKTERLRSLGLASCQDQ